VKDHVFRRSDLLRMERRRKATKQSDDQQPG
jgi:hypothetical protein